ncbi:LacI family DNA-binding transcriptional regulator [Catellatospora bangladeshensis]|uniref:LacI family transcriptional regulator n=1 Tax=Catellatospora bangladeshensis TaxID=310355 RepID=A0A8J3J8M0_9ACTN|nr:LacI family DNA-binding transcriptional regulator [Catellatospora bangladeshensis]GIF80207.1 LacI family transcriptional regulator [Catellatospora bangladeshensis]
MRVTIADIARLAGVSKATVSRVLNGRPDVDQATQARIQEIMAETGYVPSARAVGLASGRSRTVGVLAPSLHTPWMPELLQGVADGLAPTGYGLLLHAAAGDGPALERFAASVRAHAVDGVLAVDPGEAVAELRELHDHGLPVVVVETGGRPSGLPSVGADYPGGGAGAADLLLAAGRLRIAMITGPAADGFGNACAEGFTDRLTGTGAVLRASHVTEADGSEQGGYDAVQRLLRARLFFDGLFVHGDAMAAGALRALYESGRQVPGEVAVVGLGDVAPAAYTSPPLTTVRVPWAELGAAAARDLVTRLDGGRPAAPAAPLATTLVVRGSTPPVGRIPGQRSRRVRAEQLPAIAVAAPFPEPVPER